MKSNVNPIIVDTNDGNVEVQNVYKLAVKLYGYKFEYGENGALDLTRVFPGMGDMHELKNAARMFMDVYDWLVACTDGATTEEHKIYAVKAYPNSNEYLTLNYDRATEEAKRKNQELDVTWVTPAVKSNVTLYYME